MTRAKTSWPMGCTNWTGDHLLNSGLCNRNLRTTDPVTSHGNPIREQSSNAQELIATLRRGVEHVQYDHPAAWIKKCESIVVSYNTCFRNHNGSNRLLKKVWPAVLRNLASLLAGWRGPLEEHNTVKNVANKSTIFCFFRGWCKLVLFTTGILRNASK